MPTTGYAAAIDSNDILMSYIPELVWATIPAYPVFQLIRLDAEGFSSTKNRIRPNEINSEGQASTAITTKEESTGSLNFSVSVGTHNALLASSIGGTFGTPLSMSAATIAAVANGFTDSGDGFVSEGLQVGQWIKVGGFLGTTINTYYQILTLAVGAITTYPAPAATEAASETITIGGSMVRNGLVVQTFTFQKQLSASLFLLYAGAFPIGGTLDVGVGDYLKGTMSFLNKDESKAVSESGDSAPTAAPTGTVIDSVNGISNVLRNNAAIGGIIQKIGVKWDKEGARSQYGIGAAAAQGLGKGKLNVNGTLSSYFANFTLYDEFTAETNVSLSFRALDDAGIGYIITFCKATIMNPKIVAGGPSQDIMAEFEIEGNPGDTTLYGGKTIQIDYFAA